MQLNLMRTKIHRATVTGADLDYEGSISIDRDLIEAAGFFLNERVEIYNVTNGERFSTYVIEAVAGSGIITLNGAAAHKASRGDKVIICAYGLFSPEEAHEWTPTVVLVDELNRVRGA